MESHHQFTRAAQVGATRPPTNAREYLGYARQVKVGDLPRPAVVRLAAELRRQLGQVLDAMQADVALTDDQLVTLGQALADAITYRDPQGICTTCDATPGELCDDHADDVDKTDAYLQLARELGIELER
jgi:hypothetical protein